MTGAESLMRWENHIVQFVFIGFHHGLAQVCNRFIGAEVSGEVHLVDLPIWVGLGTNSGYCRN